MAQYLPTVDLWSNGITQAIRTGQLTLQSGQWVTCGDNVKSRFDSATVYHIRVFHGQTEGEAIRKYLEYKAREKSVRNR